MKDSTRVPVRRVKPAMAAPLNPGYITGLHATGGTSVRLDLYFVENWVTRRRPGDPGRPSLPWCGSGGRTS
jgi:hypothetical protein